MAGREVSEISQRMLLQEEGRYEIEGSSGTSGIERRGFWSNPSCGRFRKQSEG